MIHERVHVPLRPSEPPRDGRWLTASPPEYITPLREETGNFSFTPRRTPWYSLEDYSYTTCSKIEQRGGPARYFRCHPVIEQVKSQDLLRQKSQQPFPPHPQAVEPRPVTMEVVTTDSFFHPSDSAKSRDGGGRYNGFILLPKRSSQTRYNGNLHNAFVLPLKWSSQDSLRRIHPLTQAIEPKPAMTEVVTTDSFSHLSGRVKTRYNGSRHGGSILLPKRSSQDSLCRKPP
ncbi:hypothetical protein GW17_00030030 [Ensete ventricosum]|nr:hypothetical protein GW17_00030030 [Ensete ventricosum]